MSINFDPKTNSNTNLIDTTILGCQKGQNALIQSPKTANPGCMGFIQKIIHWIFHADERISRVRAVFDAQIDQFNIKEAKLSEVVNFQANCSYFNQRVIKKHNDSWVSYFLFWNRVDLIDEKKLNTLLETKLSHEASRLGQATQFQEADTTFLIEAKSLKAQLEKFKGYQQVLALELFSNPWINQLEELNKKSLNAKNAGEVGALRGEFKRMVRNKPSNFAENALGMINKKIALLERMEILLNRWQSFAPPVTEGMEIHYKKTLEASQEDPAMAANPYILSILEKVKSIFSKLKPAVPN